MQRQSKFYVEIISKVLFKNKSLYIFKVLVFLFIFLQLNNMYCARVKQNFFLLLLFHFPFFFFLFFLVSSPVF